MRAIFFLAFIFMSASLVAAPKKPTTLMQVRVSNQKVHHSYAVQKTTDSKPQHVLVFKDGKKKAQKVPLTEGQAISLLTHARDILWERDYRRKPAAAQKTCREYAKLGATSMKPSTICYEDAPSARQTERLLNILHGLAKR